MTDIDVSWFKQCFSAGLIRNRMLEVGSAKVQGTPNLCEIAKDLGVNDTLGADADARCGGVDVVVDFALPPSNFGKTNTMGHFETVCVFNVLEHTFDPITVLSNALSCVAEGGTLLAVAPSIWPVHNYPGDYNRLLPDWFVEFATRNKVILLENQFCWLSQFGIEKIDVSTAQVPAYLFRTNKVQTFRYWTSRLAHKVLNTYGRSHWATNCAIGAVFKKPS